MHVPNDQQGPLMMPSRFGPNSGMLPGRALGLMNSSASWRPWMEGQGPLGGGCRARGRRAREKEERERGSKEDGGELTNMVNEAGAASGGGGGPRQRGQEEEL